MTDSPVLGEWDETGADETSAADTEEAGPEQTEPGLYYGSVDDFVREMVVPVFRRRTGDRGNSMRWAADWWRYPEAVIRLEALWRAWEHLRLDPDTGLSVWLREHADHHLGVLFSPEGPFAKSTDASDAGDPLPYTAPPDGLFPDVRNDAHTRLRAEPRSDI